MTDDWWELAGHSMWPLAAPLQVRLVRPGSGSGCGDRETRSTRSLTPAASRLAFGSGSGPGSGLHVGDVVAVLCPARDGQPRVWLHRVVSIEGSVLVLRGDTNARPDPPVPLSAVLGVVDAVRWGSVEVSWPRGRSAAALVWRGMGRGWALAAPVAKRAFRRATRRASKT